LAGFIPSNALLLRDSAGFVRAPIVCFHRLAGFESFLFVFPVVAGVRLAGFALSLPADTLLPRFAWIGIRLSKNQTAD
jgi:hypothetical protein